MDIIVGTPGRVNDLLEMGYLEPDKITYLVMDEADRMLDMGFGESTMLCCGSCIY